MSRVGEARSPGWQWENRKLFFAGRITATSSGAAQTLYTAPSTVDIHTGVQKQRIELHSIRMMNNDSATRTLALYIIPSGQSIGNDYLITPSAMNIAAGTLYHEVGVDEILNPGDTIQAYASVTNVVVVRLTGIIYEA